MALPENLLNILGNMMMPPNNAGINQFPGPQKGRILIKR